MVADYSEWEIVFAWIPNSDGTPPDHAHPCIYAGESREKPGHVVVIGITSQYEYWDEEYSWRLPWQPDGKGETGLNKDSFAQAHWQFHVPLAAVRKYCGYTPEPDQQPIADRAVLHLRRKAAVREKT